MLRLNLFLSLLLLLGGCPNIISATNGDQPIEENRARRTVGAVFDDGSIETTINVNLNANEQLRDANITVVSFNGVVLLVGQIPTQDLKNEATRIATSSSSRIKTVHNELEVGGVTTFMSKSNDAWISTKLKTMMLADPTVAGLRTKVVTENGVVYLMGLVSQEEADITADLVSTTRGVRKVVRAFEYIN